MVISLASNPNLEDQASVLVSTVAVCRSCTPTHRVSLLSLWLEGLRWMCCNAPQHGTCISTSALKFCAVSRVLTSVSWNTLLCSVPQEVEISGLKTSWPESASQLYSDRRLSAKLVPTFATRGRHVVSVTDLYGRIHGFIDRSRYFLFQVAPYLYLPGWVDSVPDPLLLRKSGSAGNRTRTSGSVARNFDPYTTESKYQGYVT
jgi:hypothetical protein